MPDTQVKKPVVHRGRVIRTERITPHMIRVVLGGDGLDRLEAGKFTDHYIKMHFPLPGVEYADPTDIAAIRRDLPRDRWPRTRTYTIRDWDAEARELTVDFVHHGTTGVAGPWAASARPGDVIAFSGPGGGYAPSAEAGWHLLAGDESALPAVAAALESMPAGARARAFIEIGDARDEQVIESAADLELVWLHRGAATVGTLLVEAVTGLEFPDGPVQVFIHGEAHFVKELRRHLRADRGLLPGQLSVSGYWRRGADEDVWQATKGEWNRDPVPVNGADTTVASG
ncbi:siderophore-interacting protein [Streptomyces sp. NPDC005790]|uniref:siderophore-interacting protein n=1 Tax=Streptomyces sp. NPDC005790 TaxID=3154777 RepID=UPI0033C1BC22